MLKQIAVSFSNAEKLEDQILSVPYDSRVFELPSGGFVVLPAERAALYSEEQLAGIVADVDSMICGDDCK
jgi:hypothetical protein